MTTILIAWYLICAILTLKIGKEIIKENKGYWQYQMRKRQRSE